MTYTATSKLITLALSILITNFSFAQNTKHALEEKPNVIFIMADDMGAGMLSYYGQKFFSTPHIDQLARKGVVFENAYSSGYCAPSRATLLTGYSDCRKGKYILTNAGVYTQTALGKLSDDMAQQAVNSAIGKEPDVQYLPMIFKQAGYVTGQIGKLEYGFSTTAKQLNHHGWDYHYGYYDHAQCHGFYPMFLHENGNRIPIVGNTHPNAGKEGESGSDSLQENRRWDRNGKQVYSQDLFLQKIISFIRINKDRPFFLYHPTQLPHGPVAIPSIHPELASQNGLTNIEKAYGSMVKRLDDDISLIQQELERLGIAEKTIIVFTADNGHEIYTTFKGRVDKPYRNMQTGELFDNITQKFYSQIAGDIFDGNHGMAGMKRSNWNGAVKVPLFIYWPEKFKKGVVSQRLVTNYDFIATMADLLNIQLKDKKDGVSYLAELQIARKAHPEHDAIAFASFMGPALVTRDGWKLRYYAPKKIFQLFFLPKDYKEEHDLSAQYPEKIRELTAKLVEKCDGNLENGWFAEEREISPVKW